MARAESGTTLKGLRVLEVGDLPAARYCGRLFADFGADVIRLEPSGCDLLRKRPPMVNVGEEEKGAWSLVLNANKQLVKTEPELSSDFDELISEADVLIDSLSPQERSEFNIDHTKLRKANPGLIIISPSWFGEEGPYKDYKATELTCRALAGMVYLVGPAEGPPTPIPDYQCDTVAGLNIFVAACAAIHSRKDLSGRRLSLSVMECAATLAEYNVALDWAAGRRDHRWGKNRFWPNYPLGIFKCKKGWIGVTVVTFMQWVTFCELTGMEELAHDPDYAINRQRIARADELEARFAPVFLTKTAQEWFEIGMEARMPFVVVPDIAELIETEEFNRRGAFRTSHCGKARFKLPATLLGLAECEPLKENLVETFGSSAGEWKSSGTSMDLSAVITGRKKSLDDLIVVDLSMGWAGPHASRILGDLGADVIKVEACGYPDWWRGVDNRPIVMEQRLYEKSAYFNVMNRNKRGITLDLTTPEGVEMTKKLVEQADIVIENYSASVLPKLGLDYEVLRKIRPELIMISMPAFAADGPWRELRAYGSTLEQAAGLPSVAGTPNGPPQGSHIAYGDPVGGITGAAALLLALLHRNRTGRGQKIDLSQVEGSLPLIAPWIVEQSANGSISPRSGKGHAGFVPYGSFRCKGDDAWIVIAVETEREWLDLCKIIDAQSLTLDQNLRTLDGRKLREEEIDRIVTLWTSTKTPHEAMEILQAANIPSGIAYSPIDLLEDPHLKARGFWQLMEREWIENQPYPSPVFREEQDVEIIQRAAPTLGQHNAEVLQEKLGLTEAQLTILETKGIIGQEAVPPHLRKARASVGAAQSGEKPLKRERGNA